MAGDGVLDFAGGTVVHINAGIAGLVACLVLGRRTGYGTESMAPFNLVLTLIGASLLWVGWFGFNAGSALAANGTAGVAMVTTQVATAMAALAWMFSEWLVHGKPSLLGIASGAIAGLVAITPACGFVDPKGALVIGAAAGVGCYICSTGLKKMLGYDDSLDVFGVHGVGGIIGAILTGVFAVEAWGGKAGLLEGNFAQVPIQVYGVLATIAWSCRRHLRDPDHPQVHDRHSRQRSPPRSKASTSRCTASPFSKPHCGSRASSYGSRPAHVSRACAFP